MRIVGGESRGRRLKSLPGRSVRPTSERTREALFDMLGERVTGSRFLDLFAGVGAVGLEALSRGAAQVVLVEASERAARVIRQNLDLLGGGDRVRLIRGNAASAVRGLAAAGANFDIVFMDPPYRDRRSLERTLAAVAGGAGAETLEGKDEVGAAARENEGVGGVLAPGGLVVVEHDAHGAPVSAVGNLSLERSRRFGDATLTFFRPRPAHLPQPRLGIQHMAKAVYPGSFDPVTNGHLDIIERAAELFEEVVVAVAVNSVKAPLFSADERVALLREVCGHLVNVRVDRFDGLLVEFAARQGASVVIKGLRAVSDFEYELQQALMNRHLGHGVETVFFMTSPENLFLSSSLIREVASLGGDVSQFVPPQVRAGLEQKYGRTGEPGAGRG